MAIFSYYFLSKLKRLIIPLGNFLRISDERLFDEILLFLELVIVLGFQHLFFQLRRNKAGAFLVKSSCGVIAFCRMHLEIVHND